MGFIFTKELRDNGAKVTFYFATSLLDSQSFPARTGAGRAVLPLK